MNRQAGIKTLFLTLVVGLMVSVFGACSKADDIHPGEHHPDHENAYLTIGSGWYHVVDAAFVKSVVPESYKFTFFVEDITLELLLPQGVVAHEVDNSVVKSYITYRDGGHTMVASGMVYLNDADTVCVRLEGRLETGDTIRFYYKGHVEDAREPVGNGSIVVGENSSLINLLWVEKTQGGYRYSFTNMDYSTLFCVSSEKLLDEGDYYILGDNAVNVVLQSMNGEAMLNYLSQGVIAIRKAGDDYFIAISGTSSYGDVSFSYKGRMLEYGRGIGEECE